MLLEQIDALISGGAELIQVRDKAATPAELYDRALAAVRLAHSRKIRLIVNDRVDIALAAGADGVHLGQDDMRAEHARRLMGADAIIGFSTHSIEQAAAAAVLPIDYIAIGPIFATTTKTDHEPVVGLNSLTAVVAAADVPVVAIGGITLDRLDSVFGAGASSAAMIGGLLNTPCPLTEAMGKAVRRATRA